MPAKLIHIVVCSSSLLFFCFCVVFYCMNLPQVICPFTIDRFLDDFFLFLLLRPKLYLWPFLHISWWVFKVNLTFSYFKIFIVSEIRKPFFLQTISGGFSYWVNTLMFVTVSVSFVYGIEEILSCFFKKMSHFRTIKPKTSCIVESIL